jgi:peptidoglycan/LPS O-acetylase OafA/YrhL
MSSYAGSTPVDSGFLHLPSTTLGRVSAGLFIGAIVLIVLGATVLGSVLPSTGSLNLGPALGVLMLVAAAVTGAVALLRSHERSWMVWVSTVLPAVVVGAEILSMLIPGE